MDAIQAIAGFTQFIGTTRVHPVIFPFPLALTLHAIRISLVYQYNVKASGNQRQLPWGTYIAGFLMMAWGGAIISHFILALPPPQLYVGELWIIYVSMHLLTTAFFPLVSSVVSGRTIDVLCPIFDAILRVNGIVGAVELAQHHPDARLQQSLFLRLFIGAVVSSGGGVLATTLSVWKPDWTFTTPVFLRGGILATLDFWGGALIAGIYGLITSSHPYYERILTTALGVAETEPLLTAIEAKAASVLVLASLFAWRAWRAAITEWSPSQASGEKVKKVKQT